MPGCLRRILRGIPESNDVPFPRLAREPGILSPHEEKTTCVLLQSTDLIDLGSNNKVTFSFLGVDFLLLHLDNMSQPWALVDIFQQLLQRLIASLSLSFDLWGS